ncbi:hypothetical protein RRF57_009444 [Xylaria bambusicola]|uniref:Uncharacterized protein n=1 Tax=Xylaria bambusicola TaxID=326684 RepID=A0AAN7UJN0_9PEZI
MGKGLDEARAHGDDAPEEGQTRQPDAGRDLFEDEVARDFAEDVRRVEDGEADVVLVVRDADFVLETVKTRVAHVGPVEEGAQEQHGEEREDSVRLGKKRVVVSSRL